HRAIPCNVPSRSTTPRANFAPRGGRWWRCNASVKRHACFHVSGMMVNRSAKEFRDLRDDRVSEAAQSVHPVGYPSSHSTHVGFSCPPACSGSCGVCPLGERPRPERQSRAAGVGQRPCPPSWRTASVRLTPGCALLFGVLREPLAFASTHVGFSCDAKASGSRNTPPVGVGPRPVRAIVSRDRPTGPTPPLPPPPPHAAPVVRPVWRRCRGRKQPSPCRVCEGRQRRKPVCFRFHLLQQALQHIRHPVARLVIESNEASRE